MGRSEEKNELSPSGVDRKTFLKTAGSAALFAALGITFSGCSNSTDSGMGDNNDSNNDDGESGGSDDSSGGIVVNSDEVIIDLNSNEGSSLSSSGGWLLITSAQLLVVNVDGSTLRAFSSVCTHQNCSTNWEFSNNIFTCTCHNSRFNTSGEVVSGPATRDLPEFGVTRDGNIVTVAL